MDKRYFFERNLLSLSNSNSDLCKRLTAAETSFAHYTFLESRSGELIPALTDYSGKAHPLHSMIDPAKEGTRLVSTIEDAGFLIILGLGGAFHISAALARKDILKIVIVDFNIHGIAELLASKEYVDIFHDKRVSLIIDPPSSWIEEYIINNYKPVLFSGISLRPLRSRTVLDLEKFNAVCDEVKNAIDRVSNDFSVQSLFGKRWFSNIVKNLRTAELQKSFIPTIQHAAIIAAGPSLDIQLPRLKEASSNVFVISTDTALPLLLASEIIPDAIVSIDCQHFSSYHFIGNSQKKIPLFLDMASPATVTAQSENLHFFTSGHPLSQYISQYWKHFPLVDTSGGNVSYAALSLAHSLGAKVIDLYGADFSYPQGNTYARETYIHKLFANNQTRLLPIESQFDHFLFRNTTLQKVTTDKTWYYKTNMLNTYRKHFEHKCSVISRKVHQIEGIGASLEIQKNNFSEASNIISPFSTGMSSMTAKEFLAHYFDDIQNLHPAQDALLNVEQAGYAPSKEHHLMLTLMPLAASFKKENSKEDATTIFEMTKDYALQKIESVLTEY
ncbi:MAG: DUF115 domain-containing protein [Treponema sp.]|jgi:hypothetical protein|nr:DUF115 domain-containing protein [Treponema sp.]